MTNGQAVGIGLSIVVGLVVHAFLTREPGLRSADASQISPGTTAEWMSETERAAVRAQAVTVERIRSRSEQQKVLLAEAKGSVITLGERTLLVSTTWKEANGDLSVLTRYYEWRDGKLVQVPIVEDPAPAK